MAALSEVLQTIEANRHNPVFMNGIKLITIHLLTPVDQDQLEAFQQRALAIRNLFTGSPVPDGLETVIQRPLEPAWFEQIKKCRPSLTWS